MFTRGRGLFWRRKITRNFSYCTDLYNFIGVWSKLDNNGAVQRRVVCVGGVVRLWLPLSEMTVSLAGVQSVRR